MYELLKIIEQKGMRAEYKRLLERYDQLDVNGCPPGGNPACGTYNEKCRECVKDYLFKEPENVMY